MKFLSPTHEFEMWLNNERLEPITDYQEPHPSEVANEAAAHYLGGVLKQLYSSENINYENLEHCMEELCHQLGVAYPVGDIQVKRNKK